MHPVVSDDFIRSFIVELQNGEHLNQASALGSPEDNSRLTAICRTIFGEYLAAVANAYSLPQSIVRGITEIYDQYNGDITPGGAPERGIVALYEALGRQYANTLAWVTEHACGEMAASQREVTSHLVKLLERGYERAAEGMQFRDGDAVADQVIWTHTKFNDPEKLLYIICAHYLERIAYRFLRHTDAAINLPKDLFLNALDDMIILYHLKNHGKHYRLYDVWATPVNEGGIGYINPRKLQVYSQFETQLGVS